MSYLNPVTLTPKIYQSTDPEAPQLNQQIGDIKSIFKACLVTGYGDKIGAGFTLDNETDTVCEFISPNIMMSKFGINDTSLGVGDLYYYAKDIKSANIRIINNTRGILSSLGWTMFVCELGLYFVVHGTNSKIRDWQNCLVYYIGCIKSAINDNNLNMAAFEHGGVSPYQLIANRASNTGDYKNFDGLSNVHELARAENRHFYLTMTSDLFWKKDGVLLGSQPGLLHQVGTNLPKNHSKTTYDGKDVYYFHQTLDTTDYKMRVRSYGVMIQADNWEY